MDALCLLVILLLVPQTSALDPCARKPLPANAVECFALNSVDVIYTCKPGWVGRLCEVPYSRRCRNGGIRTVEGGCRCPPGFEGAICELKV
uniref:EGF-like domain-containing protein n=1 Tax=Steinernema glaseri TaxID=37863 RepID=A0A1I8AEP7_9BILA